MYITLNSSKFIDFEYQELRQLLEHDVSIDRNFGIISFEAGREQAEELFEKSIFVNNMLHVAKIVDITSCEDLIEPLAELAGQKTFRLEVKKIKTGIAGNAKSVEVCLGEDMEEKGCKADLDNKEILLGVVIAGSKAYIGEIAGKHLDYFRFSKYQINRAEAKIAEAFEFFHIKNQALGKALDLGAAPGGWTGFLLSKGYTVVSVDSAKLQYDKLAQYGRILVIGSKDAQASGSIDFCRIENIHDIDTSAYALIHIMEPYQQCKSLVESMGMFDLLAVDTNTSPEESASFIKSLLPLLGRNALTIATLKLVDFEIEKHIRKVEDEIGSECHLRFKWLPHNRKELTMLATKAT